MTSIHGHEVLTMMLSNGQSWTIDRLVAAIDEKFGREARFHTCSQEGMTARELVDKKAGAMARLIIYAWVSSVASSLSTK